MNAAAGVGLTIRPECSLVSRLNFEGMAMYYSQVAGNMLPFDKGHAFYVKTEADMWRFRVRAAYWDANKFVSIFGNPLYGCVGIDDESYVMPRNRMASVRLSYAQDLGNGFAWGGYADLFNNFPSDASSESRGNFHETNSMSISAGVYLRINPSYLLKKF